MAKVKHSVVIKIPHHFVNNLYLGGPHEPTEEHLALLKKYLDAQPKVESKDAGKEITGYVAQRSYVEGQEATKPALPTEAIKKGANDGYGAYPTYTTVTTTADNLLAALDVFKGAGSDGKMWSNYEKKGDYLESFTRGLNKYKTESNYYPAEEQKDGTYVRTSDEAISGKELVDGDAYIWEGWGVMYNPGQGVPESSQYGASNGYTTALMTDKNMFAKNNEFTFVYALTSYGFTYKKTGVQIHQKTVVEEIEEDIEEFLAKAEAEFKKVESGIAHIFEKVAD